MGEELPYLTAAVPGVSCAVKAYAEDFLVEERLRRPPLGHGPFVWLTVEKRRLTTHEAARRIARVLGVGLRAVGYAGLKDARAIARQTLSVEGIDPERASGLRLDGLRVLAVERDEARLKPGRGAANRFHIKLRGMAPHSVGTVERVLDELARRGLPNWFGEQRFGVRGDAWRVGKALARGNPSEALAWIAGRPGPVDTGRVLRARKLYEQGQWARAARMYPASLRDHVRICRALHKRHGDADAALRVLDRGMLQFYLAAWQSRLFNAVLEERLDGLDRLLEGDLAWRHSDGSLVSVSEPPAVAAEVGEIELSPTGPLPGREAPLPAGQVLELERAVLAQHDVTHRETSGVAWAPRGGRRALRVPMREVGHQLGRDAHGDYLQLEFELSSGAYATAVLREIHKDRRLPVER
jgi:tRNA pseudouridine13 synthase